jgi:hypothetical protein
VYGALTMNWLEILNEQEDLFIINRWCPEELKQHVVQYLTPLSTSSERLTFCMQEHTGTGPNETKTGKSLYRYSSSSSGKL